MKHFVSCGNLNAEAIVLQVLEENELSCLDLLHANTDGVILTKRSKDWNEFTFSIFYFFRIVVNLIYDFLLFFPWPKNNKECWLSMFLYAQVIWSSLGVVRVNLTSKTESIYFNSWYLMLIVGIPSFALVVAMVNAINCNCYGHVKLRSRKFHYSICWYNFGLTCAGLLSYHFVVYSKWDWFFFLVL